MLGLIVALALAQPQARPYGMEGTVGYSGGAVLGAWPEPGLAGSAWASAGFFPVTRDAPGPRVGAALWAALGAWPAQSAREPVDEAGTLSEPFPFRPAWYGLDVAIRHDPHAPWSAVVDFGLSRLDLDAYAGGPLAIPVFSARAGARRTFGPTHAEASLRAGWGQQRGFEGDWEDWWVLALGLGVGGQLR